MKLRKWTKIAIAISTGLLCLPRLVHADVCVYKPPTVRLMQGVVVDPSNQPIPTATVTIKRNGETIKTATTNDTGHFSVVSLPEGSYEIAASAVGFSTGQYNVILAHQTTGWKKYLRIRLTVGIVHCDGAIEVIKAASGSQH